MLRELFLGWLTSKCGPCKMPVRVASYIRHLAHEISDVVYSLIWQTRDNIPFEALHLIKNEMLLQLTQGRLYNTEILFRPLNVAWAPNKAIL